MADYYRFNVERLSYDSIKHKDIGMFSIVDGVSTASAGFEGIRGEWIDRTYYQTKEEALIAAQDDIKARIKEMGEYLIGDKP